MSAPPSPLPQPLPAHACPLCGADNRCAVAAAGRFDAACWCSAVTFDATALARVPPELRGLACLCPACARGAPPGDPSPA